jgi:hypothetical protein
MPLSKQPGIVPDDSDTPRSDLLAVPLDEVLFDLQIAGLPIDQGWHPDTARFWIAQAERDIYLETVDFTGLDPLREKE